MNWNSNVLLKKKIKKIEICFSESSLFLEIFNLLVFIEVLIVRWWRHTETVYIVKLFSGQAVQKLFVTSIYFFPRRKKKKMKTKTTQICFLQEDRAIMCTGQMLWNDGILPHSSGWLGVVYGKTGIDACH